MKFPELTEMPVLHVDATPDEEYPLRILHAYRENCNSKWVESTDGSEPLNLVMIQMNEDCDRRARILDRAILKLKF